MLTCGVTGCESPSFSWRTQIDSPLSGQVKTEGSKSMLTLSPVSFENEHSYLCTVTCGRKKLEKRISVDLYCKCFPELFAVFIPSVLLKETECKSVIHGGIHVFRKGSLHCEPEFSDTN